MSRFARDRRVFYFEEPVFEAVEPHLRLSVCPRTGVSVYTPILPNNIAAVDTVSLQQMLLEDMLAQNKIADYIAWYYTPMAREFAFGLKPHITIYDCMDELSAFAGAPAAMKQNEQALFANADLVFTGGATLFESKRKQHESVHLFPSSVDVAHFARARSIDRDPDDQYDLPHPRLGYAGVIDERMDVELLRSLASRRPEWQFVLLGPVVKIDPASLPQAPNIHYLGMKQYADLPQYLSGWDIGMLPFAMNDSTRFISPTKTPEYLAAGIRVVSTPIRDVITPYGDLGLVSIAGTAEEYLAAADAILARPGDAAFQARVDQFLSQFSWDKTWNEMKMVMNKSFSMNLAAAQKRLFILPSTERTKGAYV